MQEKYLFRKAFEKYELLPKDILWRRKEAFSDGVSSQKKSWFETIQEYAQTQFPNLTGIEAETKYYQDIYKKHYGSFKAVPYKWMPKFIEATDSSARTLKIYEKLI